MFRFLKHILKHTGFIKYFTNTSWLLGEHCLRLISAVFIGIWIARYLGPEQFGVLSYVLAFSSMVGSVAKLGLDNILVKELVNAPKRSLILLGTAFWLKVFGSVFVLFLISIILPFTSNTFQTKLLIYIVASGLLFQSFEVIEFHFTSKVMSKVVSICKTVQLMASSCIKLVLLLNGCDLIWFAFVAAFDFFSLGCTYVVAYFLKNSKSFYRYFDFYVAKELIKQSWPLLFTSVIIIVYMRIDQIMIKEMLGEYHVGIYSAAVKLSEVLYFIPVLVTSSIFPAIINAKKSSEKLYKKRLSWLYSLMIWSAIIIAGATTFISDKLVPLLYGYQYESAASVLKIQVWSAIFVFLGVAYSKFLILENLNKSFLKRNAIAVVLNIILNILLIPRYGIIGAAYATLLAQAYTGYLHDAFDSKLRYQFIRKTRAFYSPFKPAN